MAARLVAHLGPEALSKESVSAISTSDARLSELCGQVLVEDFFDRKRDDDFPRLSETPIPPPTQKLAGG
jgi:hypothetical protein